MADSFKMLCYAFAISFSIAVAGCAPSTANKPDNSGAATPSGPQASSAQSQSGEGQRSGISDANTQRDSSLDRLREGKSSATPAASPLKDVYYDFDRYDLKADARDTLKANADWLKSNASTRIEIEGHCDDRGTNEYNLALGAKRAQAAKDYLVTLGITGDRVSTISYGEEIPVCKEQNESCWRQNRRARFVVISARPTS